MAGDRSIAAFALSLIGGLIILVTGVLVGMIFLVVGRVNFGASTPGITIGVGFPLIVSTAPPLACVVGWERSNQNGPLMNMLMTALT